MIDVIDLKKNFHDLEVLKGINFKVEKGDIVAVIGPSGSGKSTFLRCLNCMEDPTSGKIIFNGVDIADMKVDINVHRRHMGMVFQHFNLFNNKTVLENIMEGPITVLKKDRAECEKEALSLLEKVGLSDKRDAYPGQLSGGQQQRIAIARALAMKPELLLFDEPTSALDPELEVEVLNIIRRLVDEKQTIVIITHKMSFAREVADKVVFFDEGKILKEGTYTELEQSNIPRITQFLNMLN